MNTNIFSKNEEIAHAITHGIGAILSIAGLVLLIISSSLHGNPWKIVSVTIFGLTMLFMYLSSTIVHGLPKGKWKDLFQIFDHSSIYLFIAGTYTPFLLVHLKGILVWVFFAIVCSISVTGIFFMLFFVIWFIFFFTLFFIIMFCFIVFD